MKTEIKFLEKVRVSLLRLNKESEKMSPEAYTDFQYIRLNLIPTRIDVVKKTNE